MNNRMIFFRVQENTLNGRRRTLTIAWRTVKPPSRVHRKAKTRMKAMTSPHFLKCHPREPTICLQTLLHQPTFHRLRPTIMIRVYIRLIQVLRCRQLNHKLLRCHIIRRLLHAGYNLRDIPRVLLQRRIWWALQWLLQMCRQLQLHVGLLLSLLVFFYYDTTIL